MAEETREKTNFIWEAIKADIAEGKNGGRVQTRFPPEPNGYLHIGHCKALTIDFGTAERFGGLCNLRMDDTNPTKEDVEFVDAIKEDIHWLGFDWGDRFYYGSDYFEKDYEYAVELIRKGLAYVCELTPEEFAALHTRVLAISRETRTANAIGDLNGAIDAMPKKAVTIGMAEILGAKKIRLGVFRDWHRSVVRQAAYGEVSAHFPATLIQRHPDAMIIVNANAAKQPF